MTKQVPQGYKQTSVGVIPEDWEVVKINQVLNKIIDNRGKTPPYNNSGNGIALIETNAISFSIKYPDYTKISKYVENDTYISCFRDHPQKGDVLISTVGEYAGASAILKDSEGTIAQNLIAFRPNENINSTFLFYWTRSKLFFKQLKQVMMNQAQPSLKVTWLIDFLFIEPSQKEQEKIVEILSAWDDAIAKQEELIQQKQQFKKGVMQQIFSQKIRFKDDDGSEYPAWEEKK